MEFQSNIWVWIIYNRV